MVVIEEQPQLQAHVEYDGERLPEFDADEDDTNNTIVTKYIESKSGAEFAVQFGLYQPFLQDAMRIMLCIDDEVTRLGIICDSQYEKY